MGAKAEKFKKIVGAAAKGKLLFSLGVDKFLPQIIFTFCMVIVFIWINMMIGATIHRMEKNKVVLENLASFHTEVECRLTSINSICKVEDMLKEMGSALSIPEKQATKVE